MPYKQGEMVLVPFPFTNLSTTKKRPGIVVSANWYNQQEPSYILVPITSAIREPLSRHEVIIRSAEVKRAGLLYDSVVKAGTPFTIQQDLIIKSLGQLTPSQLKQIIERMSDVLRD
jgi:mRNA interferase MazF